MPHFPIGFSSRLSACSLAVAMALGAAPAVYAQARFAIDQPQQSLAEAIQSVGKKTGTNILFDPALVAGKTARPVAGQFTADEALTRLLDGTGLVVRKASGNALVIKTREDTAGTEPVSSNGAIETTTTLAEATRSSDLQQVTPEIVVTATRINRAGFTAPTPTTEVGAQDFQNKASTTIADVLYDLPAVRTNGGNNILTTSGGNYINLRNLNANSSPRTLLLVDGRRFVPTGTFGQIDSNVIPVGLVQTVEIVTGGASAAWGSDAVAGVANIILKKKIEGFEGNIQAGMSQRNDNKNYAGSLAWGTSFAEGRGQVMIAGEYSRLFDPIYQRDRDWSNQRKGYVPKTINGVNYTRVIESGLNLSGFTDGGLIVNANGSPLAASNPLYGKQFITSTSSSPYNYGTLYGNFYAKGGDGGWIGDNVALNVPLKRKSLFARTTFDFTASLRGFAEASYAESGSNGDLLPEAIPAGGDATAYQIQRDNPLIPADIRAILNANPGIASFYISRITPEWGSWHTNNNTTTKRYAFGLDGNFGETGSWKAYATHGESNFKIYGTNNPIEANLRAALDVVQGPNGPICRINSTVASDIAITTNPAYQGYAASPGCIPANPFGIGSLTNVRDYVLGTLTNFQTYKQNAAGVSLQGEPFNNWVGPVSLAGGLDYRRETLNQVVDAVSDRRTIAFIGGGFQQNNPKSYGGSVIVKEAFAETVVPLLANLPAVKSLDFNAAVRRTDYNTSGMVSTWKGGLTYVPFTGLLLRGTRSRDIRAATLREQNVAAFSYVSVLTRDRNNPLVPYNTSQSWTQLDTGNTDLKPEVGDTTTVGVTWSPAQVKGLAVSLDFYNIKIQKAIDQQALQTTMDRCFGQGTYAGYAPDPAQCANLNFSTLNYFNKFLNLGKASTRGVDLEVSYRFPLMSLIDGAPGTLTLRALANYLDGQDTTPVNGLPIEASGAGANPHLRLNLSSTYQNGPWTLYLQARYLDATRISNTNLAVTDYYDGNSIPSVTYVNASAQYTLYDKGAKGSLQVYGNVNNLFDRVPPLILPAVNLANAGNGGTVTNTGAYDIIGRAFVAGLRFKF